jgi:hypothetical protein
VVGELIKCGEGHHLENDRFLKVDVEEEVEEQRALLVGLQ